MAECSGSGHSSSYSSLVSNRGQHYCGFSLQTQHNELGTETGQRSFLFSGGTLRCVSQPGCLRLPLVGPAPTLHVMVQGQSGCGTGCSDEPMGFCHLSLPPCPSPTQSDQQGEGRADQSSADLPILANGPLVGGAGGHDGGTSHDPPPLQDHCDTLHGGGDHSLPGPSGGSSHFRQAFASSTANLDLDQDDIDFLSNHLSSGTATGYGYVFTHFKIFCETMQTSPLTCSPAVIVKYIRRLAMSGAQYSTVNYHRSAISKFHTGVAGVPIGEHPLVCQAVKAVFRLRPPLPKYKSTFDIVPVLVHFLNQPTDNLTLKQLTFKTLFLTVYSSLSRVSSIARLGPSFTVHRESATLPFTSLEKQGRAGRVRGYLQIPVFLEDPELCPVRALVAYRDKVCSQYIRFLP